MVTLAAPIYGEERATFQLSSTQYVPTAADGSTFVDNGSTCTWTKRDGTKIVFAAFHESGNPLCLSNNIIGISYPDGRIATYYYYGSFSTSDSWTPSPILSIATNSGYMLKYRYPGTPAFGTQSKRPVIYAALASGMAAQFQGRISVMRLMGWSAIRAVTSRSQASGSRPLSLAVSMRE